MILGLESEQSPKIYSYTYNKKKIKNLVLIDLGDKLWFGVYNAPRKPHQSDYHENRTMGVGIAYHWVSP